MNSYTVREYLPQDIPQMSQLWQDVFGDSPELIKCFYHLLPALGSAVVAEADGRIAGIAHCLNCMEYVGADGTAVPCSYLYAVAVSGSKRSAGIGSELSRAAEQLSAAAGAGFFCTSPAEPSLYDWYGRILGTAPVLYRSCRRVEAAADNAGYHISRIGADEYIRLREQLLSVCPHMRLSSAGAAFLELLCSEYGGGLFSISGSVAAAYPDDDGELNIYELCSVQNTDRLSCAEALAAYLGCAEAVVFLPSDHTCTPEGPSPYLAGKGALLPSDTEWNIVFE